jgi:hypothetical protein
MILLMSGAVSMRGGQRKKAATGQPYSVEVSQVGSAGVDLCAVACEVRVTVAEAGGEQLYTTRLTRWLENVLKTKKCVQLAPQYTTVGQLTFSSGRASL